MKSIFISRARRRRAGLSRPVMTPVRRGEALAVVRIEGFDFQGATVRLREKSDAAVGQGAVHVHEQNLNLRGAPLQRGRNLERAWRQGNSSRSEWKSRV